MPETSPERDYRKNAPEGAGQDRCGRKSMLNPNSPPLPPQGDGQAVSQEPGLPVDGWRLIPQIKECSSEQSCRRVGGGPGEQQK